MSDTDGVTKGPEKLSGPIGSTLGEDIWLQPVISFIAIPGKVPELPEEVVRQLSRDQGLAYRYGHGVQNGVLPDDLVSAVIGPLVTSRWITTGVRVLCKYTRTRRPTKRLQRLVHVALNLYFPGWFRFKSRQHIQDGSKNFYYLIELTRDLHPEDRDIAQATLQNNAYWAHSENIAISMLGDESETVRRKAVLWVRRAREEFSVTDHPRQFVPPKVNFHARDYTEMINWVEVPCTEPPLTMGMTMEEVMVALKEPLRFPNYPNHTQRVEAMVRVVTEVADKRAGYDARQRMILNLLESRKICPSFKTKKDALSFL